MTDTRKKPSNSIETWPRIEVMADSMRVGKTTAVKVLAKGLKKLKLPVTASYEDWQNNPYLKKSYKDPQKVLFLSQRWFAQRKYEQLTESPNHSVFIQDLSPEGDFNYALTNKKIGRMKPAQFRAYEKFFSELNWDEVPAPDLLIYLKASDEVMLKRVEKTLRDFETVDSDYFVALKKVNRDWLKKIKNDWNVMEVDTDVVNLAESPIDKKEFVGQVLDELLELGWDYKDYVMPVDSMNPDAWEEIRAAKVVLMSGMPGSGKSYIGRKIAKSIKGEYLSSDYYRKQLMGSRRYDTRGDSLVRELSKKAYVLLFKQALKNSKDGKRSVIDASNLKPERTGHLQALLQEIDPVVMITVKGDKEIFAHRMKKKKGMANGKETYYQGWLRVYGYFEDGFDRGEYSWPSEEIDGVRVVEVWNN